MARITIIFGVLLIGQGAIAHFGSTGDKFSITAWFPAFFGTPLLLCGLLALKESLRKHAMHAAAMIGLLGALAGLGRGLMKIGALFSENNWAVVMALTMGVICAVFVALCVQSFIAARKRRQAGVEAGESSGK